MSRILVIGGLGLSLVNFRKELLQEFVDRGHEVHAAAADLTKDLATLNILRGIGVIAHDIPLSRTGLSITKDLSSVFALWKLMRRIKPGLVLAYTIKPVIWGTIAARLAGIPRRVALITGLGYALIGEARGKRKVVQTLARGLYALALRQATFAFFQNKDDFAFFRNSGLLPSTTPYRIVNGSGVNLDHFQFAELPEGPIRFLMISRLLGDKGVREYAEAAKILNAAQSDIICDLVGPVYDTPDALWQSEINSWKDVGAPIWHGPSDDVRSAIADCHVYVLPSYHEGLPRTVLEAMAMGRPIITTDAPGCRETVEPGRNGVLVPIKDAAAIARSMAEMAQDKENLVRMGLASRTIATQRFDVRKVNADMIDAMEL